MLASRLITNLLYPPVCLLCRTRPAESATGPRLSADLLCSACVASMQPNGPPECLICGVALSGAFDARHACAGCRRQRPVFDLARAPWQYAGVTETIVRQYKYHRRWRLGAWLSDRMVAIARASFPLDEVDLVAPVPSHWLKRRLRGFDAPALLAHAVASAVEKPYRPRALRRARWTRTQTDLSWAARARNVHQAFTARSAVVRQRSILLVDDVLTSGATANACAAALTDAGARAVFVLTAARTPRA